MEKLQQCEMNENDSQNGSELIVGVSLVLADESPLQKYINELKNMKTCFEIENPVRMEEDMLFK